MNQAKEMVTLSNVLISKLSKDKSKLTDEENYLIYQYNLKFYSLFSPLELNVFSSLEWNIEFKMKTSYIKSPTLFYLHLESSRNFYEIKKIR